MPRLSGLQRDVLALYRDFHRVLRSKQPAVRDTTWAYVQQRFRADAQALRRSDVSLIEYRVRQGRKQLETIKSPGFSGFSTTSSV